MDKIKLLATTALLLLLCTTGQAQFGKILGKAIENAAKNATVRKAEQKTDQAVSGAIDKATDTKTYKGEGGGGGKGEENASEGNNNPGKAAPQQGVKGAEMAYSKSDFVPGDEIIFDDPVDNEQLGEFPSKWDLISGNAEVVVVNGKKAIELINRNDFINPLMKNPKNYLGDVFTIEFDFLSVKAKNVNSRQNFTLEFLGPAKDDQRLMSFDAGNCDDNGYTYIWDSSSKDNNLGTGNLDKNLTYDTWHHFAISFNKRAWKVYINGVRIINVPNVKTPPSWFKLHLSAFTNPVSFLFTNWRIAKGAVPLYDRLASDGKIITYGITFDVGKSTIKPESMTEINRIAKLMKDNPDLKFSVEGHTDNTGNAASNQMLSEARSKAVLDKLVEMGISNDRLKSAGKGQTKPIADNSTDEGRAKNRRVEFVKM